jgi:hypothetical protein
VAVAGDGPVDGAFVLHFFVAHPVPGTEPAAAAVESALQLAPEEPVAEDGGVLANDAVLRAGGRLARVGVLEELLPAAVVDVAGKGQAKNQQTHRFVTFRLADSLPRELLDDWLRASSLKLRRTSRESTTVGRPHRSLLPRPVLRQARRTPRRPPRLLRLA